MRSLFRSGRKKKGLLANIQLLNQRAVFIQVFFGEIIEQTAALADHFEQTAAAMMVLRIFFEVRREGIDVLGENRDLDFRAARVVGRFAIFRGKLGFFIFCYWHDA